VDEDLAAVLGTQETPSLEFKESAKNTSGILQAICAFANDLPRHGGGDLLIGVDKKGEPVARLDTSDGMLLKLTDMRDNGKILARPSMELYSKPPCN
jgi:ATP-dependent DNA helicase RecG